MLDALPPEPIVTPVTYACVTEAAEAYKLHPDILSAILIVEGGEVGKTTPNTNGSHDIGPAQINSIHLPELAEMGITERELTNNGCLNIFVQAWHLARALTGAKQPTTADDYLMAVARYHSKTPKVAARYAEKLKQAFQLMYQVEN